MSEKILIIGDNRNLRTLLRLKLERDRFVVVTAPSGKEGLWRAHETRPDAILLDLTTPGTDGRMTWHQLRLAYNCPIFMLADSASKKQTVKSLPLETKDYLISPFTWRELKTCLYTVLRWSRAETYDSPWSAHSTAAT